MGRSHANTNPGPKSRSCRTSPDPTGGRCLGARSKQAQQRVGAAATKSRSQLLLGTNTPLGVSIATAAAAAAVAAGFEIAVLQLLFVMWGWQLQRFPVALEDASRHVRVALQHHNAAAVFFSAIGRRNVRSSR